MIKSLLALVVLVFLTSCNTGEAGDTKNQPFGCSNDEVKKSVMIVSINEIKNQVIYSTLLDMGLQVNATYDQVVFSSKSDKRFADAVAATDAKLKASNPQLTDVRLHGINKDTNTYGCQANILNASGNRFPIEFTAQITNDGKLFVEVYGLNK